MVIGMVIHDDDFIIGIILIEDGLKIIDISVILDIIASWYDYTHRYFIGILIDIILVLIILVLILEEIVHLLCMVEIGLDIIVWLLDIIEGQIELIGIILVVFSEAIYC